MPIATTMLLTLEDLRAVSFHDASVLAVHEDGSSITIELDCAYVGPPLQEAAGRQWTLTDCTFVCHGVRRNEKEEWDDAKQPRSHSTPERPMVEILDEEVKGDVVELGGFTERNSWAVWRIGAESFELTWMEKTEFKGFEAGITDNSDDAQ
jgi:hypothetical protein